MTTSWLTTTSVLHEMRDDPECYAWRVFIERFRGPAVRFAMKRGHDPIAAEDVAQEALAAFLGAVRDGRFDSTKGRLSTWLFGFVHRAALKERGRKARADDPRGGASYFEHLSDSRSSRTSESEDEERVWEGELLLECLSIAKRGLNDQTWQAFELTALRNVPAEEAARHLDVPVTVIYNARHRVAGRLREVRLELERER